MSRTPYEGIKVSIERLTSLNLEKVCAHFLVSFIFAGTGSFLTFSPALVISDIICYSHLDIAKSTNNKKDDIYTLQFQIRLPLSYREQHIRLEDYDV